MNDAFGKKERANFSVKSEISVNQRTTNPETSEEMVNAYGTYNIQPTANTENDFPAIAQGTPPNMEKRSKKFFRGANDKNPAADTSDKHCL